MLDLLCDFAPLSQWSTTRFSMTASLIAPYVSWRSSEIVDLIRRPIPLSVALGSLLDARVFGSTFYILAILRDVEVDPRSSLSGMARQNLRTK